MTFLNEVARSRPQTWHRWQTVLTGGTVCALLSCLLPLTADASPKPMPEPGRPAPISFSTHTTPPRQADALMGVTPISVTAAQGGTYPALDLPDAPLTPRTEFPVLDLGDNLDLQGFSGEDDAGSKGGVRLGVEVQ